MSIQNQIKENDIFWDKLIYDICSGDAVQMRELKKMDIIDFFDYIEHKENARTSRINPKGRQQSVRK